ncbi:OmpA family protein, partial [Alphaproteobacteria bacterium]|nr:OmpA family protein [Alphaproteobacteria bacterium]
LGGATQAAYQQQSTVYQQPAVYQQQQPTVYQQQASYGAAPTSSAGLTTSTRGSVDLGGATQAAYQQQSTVYQQPAVYQQVATTGARGSLDGAVSNQPGGNQGYYVADGVGTPVGIGGTTVTSQSRGSFDLQGDAFSSNVVAGSTTRGSWDLANGEQVASVGTQTFVSGTTFNDGLPLVSEDYESLPIPSDEGDLFFGARTNLAYNPALAASQRGLPVVVGQNESGIVVPGLPQPKYVDYAGGQRYYGGNSTQVASASRTKASSSSSSSSSGSLRSKLKVKAPKRQPTTQIASLPKPVAQPVLPAIPKAPASPSVTSLLPSLTPSTTTSTTPTPTLGSGFVGGGALTTGTTATTPSTSSAALTKPKSDGGSKLIMQIIFPEGSAALPDKAEGPLRSIAKKIINDPSLNIQLRAYAKSSTDGGAQSKRISLSRALSVRKFLIAEGVPSVRMDVRGLGDKSAGDKPDRLDILTVDGNS